MKSAYEYAQDFIQTHSSLFDELVDVIETKEILKVTPLFFKVADILLITNNPTIEDLYRQALWVFLLGVKKADVDNVKINLKIRMIPAFVDYIRHDFKKKYTININQKVEKELFDTPDIRKILNLERYGINNLIDYLKDPFSIIDLSQTYSNQSTLYKSRSSKLKEESREDVRDVKTDKKTKLKSMALKGAKAGLKAGAKNLVKRNIDIITSPIKDILPDNELLDNMVDKVASKAIDAGVNKIIDKAGKRIEKKIIDTNEKKTNTLAKPSSIQQKTVKVPSIDLEKALKRLKGMLKAFQGIPIDEFTRITSLRPEKIRDMIYELIADGLIMGKFEENLFKLTSPLESSIQIIEDYVKKEIS